jgi:hypothetical protein
MYTLILGNIFGRKIRWLIGGSLSSFHTLYIPKYAFVLWLAIRNRLSIGDRLANWGFNENVQCLFRRNGIENCEHLFFECSFSHRIWKAGMYRCIVDNPPSRWEEVRSLKSRNWKGTSMHATLCKRVLSSSVYNL